MKWTVVRGPVTLFSWSGYSPQRRSPGDWLHPQALCRAPVRGAELPLRTCSWSLSCPSLSGLDNAAGSPRWSRPSLALCQAAHVAVVRSISLAPARSAILGPFPAQRGYRSHRQFSRALKFERSQILAFPIAFAPIPRSETNPFQVLARGRTGIPFDRATASPSDCGRPQPLRRRLGSGLGRRCARPEHLRSSDAQIPLAAGLDWRCGKTV